MKARYAANRKNVVDQQRCPRALHRRVNGSQTRLDTVTPTTAAMMLVFVAPRARRAPATMRSITAVATTASPRRRDQGQAPFA